MRNPEITSVKTRVFTGPCFTESEYQSVILEFVKQKGKIYQMINDFNHLNKRSKKEVVSNIDAFYKIIEKPEFYQKYIAADSTLLGD